jgi:hypothetical protein
VTDSAHTDASEAQLYSIDLTPKRGRAAKSHFGSISLLLYHLEA